MMDKNNISHPDFLPPLSAAGVARPTATSRDAFINKISDEQKRKDAFTILELIEKATKIKGKMRGSSHALVDVFFHQPYES